MSLRVGGRSAPDHADTSFASKEPSPLRPPARSQAAWGNFSGDAPTGCLPLDTVYFKGAPLANISRNIGERLRSAHAALRLSRREAKTHCLELRFNQSYLAVHGARWDGAAAFLVRGSAALCMELCAWHIGGS